jgi:hypothetical protein
MDIHPSSGADSVRELYTLYPIRHIFFRAVTGRHEVKREDGVCRWIICLKDIRKGCMNQPMKLTLTAAVVRKRLISDPEGWA